jgi:hypothetical protein
MEPVFEVVQPLLIDPPTPQAFVHALQVHEVVVV